MILGGGSSRRNQSVPTNGARRTEERPDRGLTSAGRPVHGGGSLTEHPLEVVCLGGLPIARMDRRQVVDQIFAALARGCGGWLVTANVDFVQRSVSDPALRALYREADLIVADGAPLVWAARLKGQPLPERVAGSDLIWMLAERAEREGRSLYLLGGAGRAAERAAERLVERWPGLRIAGLASPWISIPPTPKELGQISDELQRVSPDLICVAFGSPKQELVISALRSKLPGAWMMGCGISLSFVAGDVRRAPRWMRRAGLEWVHRLAQEPQRLAGRYLLKNLPFAVRLLLSARSSRS